MSDALLICAHAPDSEQALTTLTARIARSGCNVIESRVTVLGREVAVIFLVDGSWDALAKLESALKKCERELGFIITSKRTETPDEGEDSGHLPYAVDAFAADKPGLVSELMEFFERRAIRVRNLSSTRYRSAHTGAATFSAHLTIAVPTDTHIATLREEFMDFCDGLNLDAIIEPIKS